MERLKKILGSRTVRLAILQAIAGILVAVFVQDPTLADIGVIAIFKSMVDFSLRLYTSKAI